MQHFLSDLCFYYTEQTEAPDTPNQRQASERFTRLEQTFIAQMGYDFAAEYQKAAYEVSKWEFDAAFLKGLQFGVQFMLTALPPQSSSPIS